MKNQGFESWTPEMGIQIHHNVSDIENLFLGCKQRFKPKIREIDLETQYQEAAL